MPKTLLTICYFPARAYWLDEPGKLASHIMVITPSNSMMHRIKEWVNSGGTAIGFDMEVRHYMYTLFLIPR